MPSIIEVEGLVKRYADYAAVNGVSFEVGESSLFAFLGPNGAGKSTTINMLCTLLGKTAGSVRIDGHELGKNDGAIRERIGVVFQESLLDELLTVRENLQARASFYRMSAAEFRNRLTEVADVLGLGEFLDRRYGQLSGGQRRRADIARALINDPRILFLDEPTTGLDPQARMHAWGTIRQLQQEKKMTVFLTTHYMEEAAMADDVAIIDHGRIVAQGTPAQLRVQHSSDHLKVMPKDGEREAVVRAVTAAGNEYAEGAGVLDIAVADSMQGLAMLKAIEPHIDHFEMIRGSMDDVFLNITGRSLREGGE